MGLKDWFKGRSLSKLEPDSVWFSGAAKLAGLCKRAENLTAEGQVLVLAHFPATLDALEAQLQQRRGVERAGSAGDVAGWLALPEAGAVGLAMVKELPEDGLELLGQATGHVSFMVAERHPLRAQDDRVERLAGRLPYSSSVQFHLALDDSLLERFLDERVKGLLGQLGMSEDESISHSAVSGAVESAQKRLALQQVSEVEAQSIEDWFEAIDPK